jgi:hypothetical protein
MDRRESTDVMDFLGPLKTIIEAGVKIVHSHEEKKEEEKMQAIVEELRLRVLTGGGNCLRPTVASEEDRFYAKMVKKGYLVRVGMGGYMLPEMFRNQGGLY